MIPRLAFAPPQNLPFSDARLKRPKVSPVAHASSPKPRQPHGCSSSRAQSKSQPFNARKTIVTCYAQLMSISTDVAAGDGVAKGVLDASIVSMPSNTGGDVLRFWRAPSTVLLTSRPWRRFSANRK